MGRRPFKCYRYQKNKPYPKSRFNRGVPGAPSVAEAARRTPARRRTHTRALRRSRAHRAASSAPQCFLEHSIAGWIKAPDMLLDLGMATDAQLATLPFEELEQLCKGRRRPPMTKERFAVELGNCRFSRGLGDHKLVVELYASCFDEVMGSVEFLDFRDMGWSEVTDLAACALPQDSGPQQALALDEPSQKRLLPSLIQYVPQAVRSKLSQARHPLDARRPAQRSCLVRAAMSHLARVVARRSKSATCSSSSWMWRSRTRPSCTGASRSG